MGGEKFWDWVDSGHMGQAGRASCYCPACLPSRLIPPSDPLLLGPSPHHLHYPCPTNTATTPATLPLPHPPIYPSPLPPATARARATYLPRTYNCLRRVTTHTPTALPPPAPPPPPPSRATCYHYHRLAVLLHSARHGVGPRNGASSRVCCRVAAIMNCSPWWLPLNIWPVVGASDVLNICRVNARSQDAGRISRRNGVRLEPRKNRNDGQAAATTPLCRQSSAVGDNERRRRAAAKRGTTSGRRRISGGIMANKT